jgi:hypothetical protein
MSQKLWQAMAVSPAVAVGSASCTDDDDALLLSGAVIVLAPCSSWGEVGGGRFGRFLIDAEIGFLLVLVLPSVAAVASRVSACMGTVAFCSEDDPRSPQNVEKGPVFFLRVTREGLSSEGEGEVHRETGVSAAGN